MRGRRVVITGLGLISPLGMGPEQVWAALLAGASGVVPLADDGRLRLPVTAGGQARAFGGQIEDFGEVPAGPKKAIRKGLKMMCREIQMGVAAAQRAATDSRGLLSYDPERVGVTFGVDHVTTEPDEFTRGMRRCQTDQRGFDFSRWGTLGMSEVTPLWLLKYLPNMPASHVAIYNDLRGPSNSLTMREAAANLALGEATTVIQRGAADAMVVGATGTRLHPLRSVHIALQEVIHPGGDEPPAEWSRPFDIGRRGMVLGEGAAAVVLEEMEAAERRGATIWGEVLSSGSAMVAQGPFRGDPRRSVALAVDGALRRAGLKPAEVGHVNAHGLGAVRGDIEESRGLEDVFGGLPTPVTALKGYTGNLGAGSGMLELVASLLALREGVVFPTRNCFNVDPACTVGIVRPGRWDVPSGESALNLSITPQGQASAVIVRRV